MPETALVAPKMPISRALIWVLLSVFMVSGPAFLMWLYYLGLIEQRAQDPAFLVTELELHPMGRHTLPSPYFQQLLNLSRDARVNLHQLHPKQLERELAASPVLREGRVVKKAPHTLSITYLAREPLARLIDYSNTLIDEEGVMFPFAPFFSDSSLPELYLGLGPGETWGKKAPNDRSRLAMEVLRTVRLKSERHVKRVDVSRSDAMSLGERQIVVVLEKEEKETILRLSPKNYAQELSCFQALLPLLKEGSSSVIEMRIPHLAFIKTL